MLLALIVIFVVAEFPIVPPVCVTVPFVAVNDVVVP